MSYWQTSGTQGEELGYTQDPTVAYFLPSAVFQGFAIISQGFQETTDIFLDHKCTWSVENVNILSGVWNLHGFLGQNLSPNELLTLWLVLTISTSHYIHRPPRCMFTRSVFDPWVETFKRDHTNHTKAVHRPCVIWVSVSSPFKRSA